MKINHILKGVLLIIVTAAFGCGTTASDDTVVFRGSHSIAMPDYYRRITGYDSIQLITRHGDLEANFCYPNEFEFEKFKKDTVICIGDTGPNTPFNKKANDRLSKWVGKINKQVVQTLKLKKTPDINALRLSDTLSVIAPFLHNTVSKNIWYSVGPYVKPNIESIIIKQQTDWQR